MKDLEVRLAAPIQHDSIVDGEGLRTVIWFQGCPHHCKGCHNPESWNYDGGIKLSIESICTDINNLHTQDGITVSGGEPFAQIDALLEIVKTAKKKQLSVWVWTGFLFEDLLEYTKSDSRYIEILKNIDVLVDGPFKLEERSLNLWFKGSKNQRVIQIPKSLKTKTPVLIPKYKREKKLPKIPIAIW